LADWVANCPLLFQDRKILGTLRNCVFAGQASPFAELSQTADRTSQKSEAYQ
jgi:hypothetical protein